MVKDFIDTNDFSAKELLDMIQLSRRPPQAHRHLPGARRPAEQGPPLPGGRHPGRLLPAADEKQEPGHDLSAVLHPDPGVL